LPAGSFTDFNGGFQLRSFSDTHAGNGKKLLYVGPINTTNAVKQRHQLAGQIFGRLSCFPNTKQNRQQFPI